MAPVLVWLESEPSSWTCVESLDDDEEEDEGEDEAAVEAEDEGTRFWIRDASMESANPDAGIVAVAPPCELWGC